MNYFSKHQVLIFKLKALFVILAILYFISASTYGQNVVINGEAKWARGKTIRLFTYADRITLTEKELTSAKIDSTGYFILKADIPNTIQSFIRLDNFSDELYIEPAKLYNIKVYTDKANQSINRGNSYQRKGTLIIDFINPDVNELNSLIRRFNYLSSDFIINDIEKILKSRSRNKLDSFKTAINADFKGITNEYFNNFKLYRIGSIEYFTRLKSNADIEKDYFYNKPILYENKEYMEFFNDFYSKYISSSNFFNYAKLDNIVNNNDGNYNDLIEVFRKDTLLKNKELLDIVIIKQLDYLYHAKGFKKENVLRILKEAQFKSASKQNKLIATNLYKLLTKLAPYTKAPSFKLNDIDGNNVSLNDFKGKFVYLTFFKTNINSCIAELKLLNVISEKYKDRIAFLCINADKDEKALERFRQEYPDFKLKLLYFNNDQDLINNYEVKVYPTFVLINDTGELLSYPAPKPSDQINKIFDKELKASRK